MTNKNRYALRKQSGDPLETPQFTHMRIAMGLSYNEPDPTAAAIEFYEHMSKLEYLPGGSTRVNAGGSFPQLSNCFLLNVDDDMESIAKSVRDTMFIAKGTGGIGIGFTKLRAAGSPVKTTNTESTGPIPFMKMIDTALVRQQFIWRTGTLILGNLLICVLTLATHICARALPIPRYLSLMNL